MKNTRKKLSLLLSAVMLATIINIVPLAFGNDLVALNETNFPDDTFIKLIAAEFDKNSDGFLSAEERNITEMDISGMVDKANWISDKQEAVSDITGIEFFQNIEILHCGGIGLETIDTSSLANLKELYCGGNYLESIDVLRNFNLEVLHCSDNFLTQLTMPSYSTTLKTLHCYANFIESLNTSGVPNLTDLRCDQNELTSLDLSGNTKLATLKCSYNHLTALDLSKTALKNVTNADISNQEVEVTAELIGDMIKIPFENRGLNASNYANCSLELENDGSGFFSDRFISYGVAAITDSFTYDCSTMLENAENMTVRVKVNRDFYQVDFYTSDNLTQQIGRALVNSGESVTPPIITDLPQCKAVDSWSENLACVTSDMNVYPIYTDNHNYTNVVLMDDQATVKVTCNNNDSSYQVLFVSVVNSKTGDANFDEHIDVNKDGYINAKDYAVLLKNK